jgi:hypothetical protein
MNLSLAIAAPTEAAAIAALKNESAQQLTGAGEFYRKCGYTERGRVMYKNNPLIYFEWLV